MKSSGFSTKPGLSATRTRAASASARVAYTPINISLSEPSGYSWAYQRMNTQCIGRLRLVQLPRHSEYIEGSDVCEHRSCCCHTDAGTRYIAFSILSRSGGW